MASLHPVPALRFRPPVEPNARYAREARAHQLLRAPDPDSALSGAYRRGELIEERGGPALYLVEVRPEPLPSSRPPVRFLFGGLRRNARTLELEQTGDRPATAPLAPVACLVQDDRQAFRGALIELSEQRPPEEEVIVDDCLVKRWRITSSSARRQLSALLEGEASRPLRPVPERQLCLGAWVSLAEPGLRLIPFHRAVRGLCPFHPDRFLTLLAGYARIYELERRLDSGAAIDAARKQLASFAGGSHAVLVVLPGGVGHIVRFRQRLDVAQIKAAPKDPTLRSLDLALLDSMVLRTVLGIVHPEGQAQGKVQPVDQLVALVAQVQGGRFQLGFGLNPPPVWEIRAVMEARQQLPHHTFRLEPEPPAGLLFLPPVWR